MNENEINDAVVNVMIAQKWNDDAPLTSDRVADLAHACFEAGLRSSLSVVGAEAGEKLADAPIWFAASDNECLLLGYENGLGVRVEFSKGLGGTIEAAKEFSARLLSLLNNDLPALVPIEGECSALAAAPLSNGEGRAGQWISVDERLPESMPDEWLGLEDEEEEVKQANRQSEDVLICRTVETPGNQPFDAVKVARYYPGAHKGKGAWLEADSRRWVFAHHWQPLPTAPTSPIAPAAPAEQDKPILGYFETSGQPVREGDAYEIDGDGHYLTPLEAQVCREQEGGEDER